MVLQAGKIKVNVDATHEDKKTYGLTFFTLDPGKDIIDLSHGINVPARSIFLVGYADSMGGESWRKQNLHP